MLDAESRAETAPSIELDEADAEIVQEGSVRKVSDEMLFYMASRGVTKDEALRMVVLGTAEVVTKRIPIEYAVEVDRLIELELGDGVGLMSRRKKTQVLSRAWQGAPHGETRESDAERARYQGGLPDPPAHHPDKRLVYLDSAATSQKPKQVIDATSDFLLEVQRERAPRDLTSSGKSPRGSTKEPARRSPRSSRRSRRPRSRSRSPRRNRSTWSPTATA